MFSYCDSLRCNHSRHKVSCWQADDVISSQDGTTSVASAAFHSLFLCINRIKRALNLNTYQTTNLFKLFKKQYVLLLLTFVDRFLILA